MGDPQCQACVLLHHKDRRALRVDGRYQLEHPVYIQRRQTHRRFVHADQLRPAHKGARHRDHLLFAAGQCARSLGDPFGDAREEFQHPFIILPDRGLVAAAIGAHQQVLAHGHRREQTPRFRHRGDAEADDPRRWELRVTDTGPGIHPGSGEMMVQALNTGDPPGDRGGDERTGGAEAGEGIGLSIVKRLCELLDATIQLKSTKDVGTTFRILFPRHYAT